MTQAPDSCQLPDTTSPETGTNAAQTANVALLPCPHCGSSSAPKLKLWDGDPPMPGFYVICDAAGWDGMEGRGCGCSGAYGETKIDAVEAWNRRAAPTLPADEKGLVDEWRSPDEMPDTPKGTEQNFIVAVRRARSGKVYSFPSAYLNAYPLRYEYECPKGEGCDGNGCEDGCPITGWYSATGDGEDGLTYSPMYMDPGDEFLGWRKVPQWPASADMDG